MKVRALRLLIGSVLFPALSIGLLGCSSMLYHPTSETYFDPKQGGLSYDDVSFSSQNGRKLHGWYFRTAARKKPKATIVFFHGNGENLTSHFATLAWILPYGYDYLIFDYQGYGSSEGEPSPEGTVQDGIAALRFVKGRAPESPLVVFAQSLGGAVALRTLIELKGEVPVRLVVIDSSFLSYQAAGRSVLSQHWLTWILQPFSTLVLSDAWAPGERVAEISPTPLVVLHGDQDQVIDFKLGERLFEKAKEPKEFWRVENGRHTDAFWRHGTLYRERFLKRLEQALAR